MAWKIKPLKSTKDKAAEARKEASLRALRKKAERGYGGFAACRAALEVATAKAHIAGDTAFAVGVNSSNVRKVTR
jgi:hypothetical protein